jgi:hypothetical protein
MHSRGPLSKEWSGDDEHQSHAKNEATRGRGAVRHIQEVDAKREQSALGQQAMAAIGLLFVSHEA